jgi:glycine/D-amino acid oxidase-like deaminating enzyme
MQITVVGAGIVGAACARSLATHGANVTIVESRFPGGGATAAGMGHVVVMDDSPAQLALTSRSRDLWNRLAADLPPEAEFRLTGTLWVAADADEMEEAERKRRLLLAAGIAADLLDADRLAKAEPNLRTGLAGGLLVPDDAVLYPPPAAAWMIADAVARGSTLLRESPVGEVTAPDLSPGSVRLTDGRVIAGDAVILAAGIDSVRLLPELPLRPRKGHLVITDRAEGFLTRQVIELGYVKRAHDVGTDSVAFNVQPRATGQLLIGSSRQIDVSDRGIDHAILQRMLDRCLDFMPGLGSLPGIRAWTGFRAATPDGLPLVGPCPGRPGIWLATGHEGLGITTSLATAELLAAQLLGAACPLDAAASLPARFATGAAPAQHAEVST